MHPSLESLHLSMESWRVHSWNRCASILRMLSNLDVGSVLDGRLPASDGTADGASLHAASIRPDKHLFAKDRPHRIVSAPTPHKSSGLLVHATHTEIFSMHVHMSREEKCPKMGLPLCICILLLQDACVVLWVILYVISPRGMRPRGTPSRRG